jgi:predicted negative regulator of RcsB-dependent stress response
MAYDLDEQEQLDQMKAFWAKWGNVITWTVTAIALGFAAFYGYKAYQRSQTQKAAPLFEQLEKAANDVKTDAKNPQLVADLAAKLTTEYASTPYAQMGALLAAKVQTELGKGKEAQALLQWTMDKAVDPEYSQLARVRLAGVLIDDKKVAEALALIPATAPTGFEALYADRRGDALAASGKTADAVVEYQKAWTAVAENGALRGVIEQKMQALGAEVVKPVKAEKAAN